MIIYMKKYVFFICGYKENKHGIIEKYIKETFNVLMLSILYYVVILKFKENI